MKWCSVVFCSQTTPGCVSGFTSVSWRGDSERPSQTKPSLADNRHAAQVFAHQVQVRGRSPSASVLSVPTARPRACRGACPRHAFLEILVCQPMLPTSLRELGDSGMLRRGRGRCWVGASRGDSSRARGYDVNRRNSTCDLGRKLKHTPLRGSQSEN